MRAKDFLNQARMLDKIVENKITEKEQWLAIATSTTAAAGQTVKIKNKKGEMEEHALERVQSSGNQQKMSAAVDRCIDLDKEIDDCVDRLANAKKEINAVIETLDVIGYDVLHKMYIGVVSKDNDERIKYYSLRDVADHYDHSYNWAKDKRSKALKAVQRILDERERAENAQA